MEQLLRSTFCETALPIYLIEKDPMILNRSYLRLRSEIPSLSMKNRT